MNYEMDLKSLVGQTISSIECNETCGGEPHTITIKTESGDSVQISPSSYNYGGQHLIIED